MTEPTKSEFGLVVKNHGYKGEPTMTLREKVLSVIGDYHHLDEAQVADAIATFLEDTGHPAHMRVAVELRGK